MSRHSSAFTLMKRGLREPRRISAYLGGLLADIPELTRYEPVFKLALRLQGANLSPELPTLYHHSRTRVLQSEDDVDAALRAVRSLGLHPHPTDAKNWDAFLVLRSVLKHTNPESAVLDAGGAPYSPLVEWLYLYGYRDLHVYNIDLERDFSPVSYP